MTDLTPLRQVGIYSKNAIYCELMKLTFSKVPHIKPMIDMFFIVLQPFFDLDMPVSDNHFEHQIVSLEKVNASYQTFFFHVDTIVYFSTLK